MLRTCNQCKAVQGTTLHLCNTYPVYIHRWGCHPYRMHLLTMHYTLYVTGIPSYGCMPTYHHGAYTVQLHNAMQCHAMQCNSVYLLPCNRHTNHYGLLVGCWSLLSSSYFLASPNAMHWPLRMAYSRLLLRVSQHQQPIPGMRTRKTCSATPTTHC